MQGQGKYKEISDVYEARILGGEFAAGTPFPSVETICRKFNVARSTAVHAVSELRRKGLVRTLPSVGSVVARASRLLGLILPGVAYSEFFPPILAEISRKCQRNGYGLLFGDVANPDPVQRARQAVAFAHDLVSKRPAGVFFQPLTFLDDSERTNRAISDVFARAGVPLILLDCDIVPAPQRSSFDLVGINNYDAGRRLGAHLLDVGVRRVLFVARSACRSVADRADGLSKVLSTSAAFAHVMLDGTKDEASFRRAFRRVEPDAVVCANDTIAVHVRKFLDALSRRVPEDVRLAGFDDSLCATILSPPLTTIRQPCADIASNAFDMMLARLADPSAAPKEISLPAPLVVRRSTGR